MMAAFARVAMLLLAAPSGLVVAPLGALAAAPSTAVAVVDQTGREVPLPRLPERIVSLVPSASETLFALGAEDRLVGVTDFCDFPPAARSKPSVGGMVGPSLERIVALRPDLVVATTAGNREETFAQLRRLGIPVYLVNPTSVEEALDMMARLAALTERQAAGRALIGGLERRIRAIEERVAPWARPRVLYVLWPEPLIVPGKGAVVSELIRLAGGESVTAGLPDAYPHLSAEAAVARAPEVIFLARHGATTASIDRERWERFRGLPAVRAGRLHDVDGSVLHRYGPRVVEGLETLARLIHPEAFPR